MENYRKKSHKVSHMNTHNCIKLYPLRQETTIHMFSLVNISYVVSKAIDF